MVSLLVRLGIVPRWHLLAVEGRVTGEFRETLIDPIEVEGKRYLVAPFGVVNWVRNARKAGRVRLRKGSEVEFLEVKEVSPVESAPFFTPISYGVIRRTISMRAKTLPRPNLMPKPATIQF
jgi:hypothetical protein